MWELFHSVHCWCWHLLMISVNLHTEGPTHASYSNTSHRGPPRSLLAREIPTENPPAYPYCLNSSHKAPHVGLIYLHTPHGEMYTSLLHLPLRHTATDGSRHVLYASLLPPYPKPSYYDLWLLWFWRLSYIQTDREADIQMETRQAYRQQTEHDNALAWDGTSENRVILISSLSTLFTGSISR